MIKKSILILTVAIAVLFTGCKKYDRAINNIKNRLDKIEGTYLGTINQQITNINASITDLQAVDTELQKLIDNLQTKVDELQASSAPDAATEIANIKTLIATLQNKDTELDKKITDLQTYADSTITNTENWANATFATLEQYQAVQTEIAALKALIEENKTGLTPEDRKYIENAIATSETYMKEWVNTALADGYYDIAAIDAKLAAMETMLTDGDEQLAKEIENQQVALEQAKAELTAAYKDAIADAIETNNGVINAAIAQAITETLDKVDVKLAVIDNKITAIQKDIEDIKSNIATINQQIANINASITDLQAVDTELQKLIDALDAKVKDLEAQIDTNHTPDENLENEIANIKTLIAALQSKDAEFDKKVADLQTYVDSDITNTENWANATFATLEQYQAVQTEIAALKVLIGNSSNGGNNGGNSGATIEELTAALTTVITASETSMKAWVNNTLASGYYDIAAIDAKLATIEAKFAGADEEFAKDIENQQAALEQAKAELTAAYEKAIEDAIETNNGVINPDIAVEIADALDKVDVKLAVIENKIVAIEKEIENIKSNIATINQQITNINASITDLQAVDTELQKLIDNLQTKVDELQASSAPDAATEIENIKTLIATLQNKDTELDKKITDLQTYVNSTITNTENWANATFATLEQYQVVQTEIAALKAILGNNGGNDNGGSLEEFTAAISTAITASETSMKEWVNKTLAKGYYDIAAIDAKLAAMETKLTDGDEQLAKEIENQQAALEQAKAELTAAYKDAITDAIETNKGAINATIAAEIADALNKVDVKLAVIDNKIAAIQKDIEDIKSNIATINQQITGINASINELQSVDTELRVLINTLQSEIKTLQDKLDANTTADAVTKAEIETEIGTLKAQVNEYQFALSNIQQQVSALTSYVDTQITMNKNWASATFATLEQYAQMQTEISALKALIGNNGSNNGGGSFEELTAALTTAITASETSMKAWVNKTLAEGYYDIATIDAKLAVLKSELTSADTNLAQQIENQNAALEQAKNAIKDAYTKAINEAILNNEGIITTKITTAVNEAKSELQAQINAINTSISSIQTQINNIANRIQDVTFIPKFTDGKIKLDYTTKTTQAHLRISPAALAGQIDKSMVQAFALYTTDPTTRSFAAEFPLIVTAVVGNASSGMLQIDLAEDSNNTFSYDFWQGNVEAIIYIRIYNGNSDVLSPAIPIVAHKYVSSSSVIGGFDNGQNASGTVK